MPFDLLCSSHDQVVPSELSSSIARFGSHVTLTTIDGAAHCLNFETPEETLAFSRECQER